MWSQLPIIDQRSTIAHELKIQLLQTGHKIAVAESLTGGHLQATITSVSGASEYFLGGLTAYNIDQKVNLLGVDREHAASVNCVSQQVATEMAAGVRKMFGSDISIATTGYAEAWPEGDIEKPFAWYAINICGNVQSNRIEPAAVDRQQVQDFVARSVLDKLIALLGNHN